nr:type IV secretion system DNA-binding domain-containing protein [Halomarina salina]
MLLAARQTLSEFFRGHPSCRWLLAVHRDTDHPHVQVALTGQRHDLYLDADDLSALRQLAADQFREGHEQNRPHGRSLAVLPLAPWIADVPTPGPLVLVLGAVVVLAVFAGLWIIGREVLSRVGWFAASRSGGWVLPLRIITDRRPSRFAGWLPHIGIERRSTLFLGSSGAGKTNAIGHLLPQLADEGPLIVFDYKGDFGAGDFDRPTIRFTTSGWNLFNEVRDEFEIREMCRSLFPPADDGDFFLAAARQVFTVVCIYLWREADEQGEDISNADLVAFFQSRSRLDVYESLGSYTDLDRSALDPDADRQAAGVWASVQQVVTDLFSGFASSTGEFAIREYIENPDGAVLLLDYPIVQGESAKPLFRWAIDWAIRWSLADSSTPCTFVLDEFDRLPRVRRLDDLVNAGRSTDTRAILGVQSIGQLEDSYGKGRASALLSGLVQQVLLQSHDTSSLDHIQEEMGLDDAPLDRSVIQRFKPGECVVRLVRGEWVRGRVPLVGSITPLQSLTRAFENRR